MKLLNPFKNICTGLLLATAALTQAQTIALDKVIAVVDRDVIMASELQQRMALLANQLRGKTDLPPADVLQRQILEQLIAESLQLQMAERGGVTITDAELDAAIENMKKANGLNDAMLAAKLQQDGLTLVSVRDQIRRDMLIDHVQQGSVNRRIRISDQEVDNFLRSKEAEILSSPDYLLGHIFIALTDGTAAAEEDARSKASAIYDQLQNGANFRQLAIANSNDPNALKGGDLGWRKGVQLPELFSTALAKIPAAGITPPLRSGAGYHIIKVYEQRGAEQKIIEQAKVRHILIKPSDILSDDDARLKLAKIRQQIVNGADFGDMARANSEDIGSMLSGGDLGWSLPGKFVPEFETAMQSTVTGDISAPFRSQFGWHILRVDERRREDMSDTYKRNQARNLLRSRRFEEERINWLREIRDEAFVEIKN